MRKKLNLLFGLVLIISMIILTGCGGSGETGEKNPYEGKWVAVSAQMMGMSVSIDEWSHTRRLHIGQILKISFA